MNWSFFNSSSPLPPKDCFSKILWIAVQILQGESWWLPLLLQSYKFTTSISAKRYMSQKIILPYVKPWCNYPGRLSFLDGELSLEGTAPTLLGRIAAKNVGMSSLWEYNISILEIYKPKWTKGVSVGGAYTFPMFIHCLRICGHIMLWIVCLMPTWGL